MYKVDLHTHSIISYDGGLSAQDYKKLLEQGIVDCIAITDHNETRFARELHGEFGEKIIVGEEIQTNEGEIIGLFLKQTIPRGLTAQETVKQILIQNGLVYVPHPFETMRKGIQLDILQTIANDITVVEVFNARALLRGKAKQTVEFANQFHIPGAASSDAHCYSGVGCAFSIVEEMPTSQMLQQLLKKETLQKKYAPLYSLLCPEVNKLIKAYQFYSKTPSPFRRRLG